MDHLEFLLGPAHRAESFKIPYLLAESCLRDGDFKSFGQRKGYTCVQDLVDLHHEHPKVFTTLIQRWLYFGLLQEVCCSECNTDDFIVRGSSGNLVSTTLLPQYCQTWARELSIQSEDEIQERCENKLFASSLCERLDEEIVGPPSSEAHIILFSIKILIETLAAVPAIVHSPIEGFSRPAASKFLINYLHVTGWCPARISIISSRLESTTLYLFTAYQPAILIGSTHQGCSKQACYADNLKNYSPQHTPSCSGNSCPLVQVPSKKLEAICNSGEVPLISCAKDSSGEFTIDVVPTKQSSSFIAFSHVWSEGLGNDTANALCRCQFYSIVEEAQRLREQLDAGSASDASAFSRSQKKPILLWLDTMCIPLEKNARKLAIGHINWTIAAADAVLVRDSGIRNLPMPVEISALQLAIEMHCMKWLTRCWTLAEGVAAWKTYIQFSDGAYKLKEVIEHLETHAYNVLGAARAYNARSGRQSQGLDYPFEDLHPQSFEPILQSRAQLDLLKVFSIFDYAKWGRSDLVSTWNSILHRVAINSTSITRLSTWLTSTNPTKLNVAYSLWPTNSILS